VPAFSPVGSTPARATLSTPPHKRRVEISASCTMPSVFDPLFAVRSPKGWGCVLERLLSYT
jgi:hypothetical protein